MALMYTVAYRDPNIAGQFPPSIYSSDWWLRLSDYQRTNAVLGPNTTSFVFDTKEELNAFLSEYQLKDPDLIAEIQAWQTAHEITNFTLFHEITATSIPGDLVGFCPELGV